MKIMYVNDSCYNFVDKKGINQAQLLVEGRSLNFLDVRIFQLASMINGKVWMVIEPFDSFGFVK